jgi:hypothetical protein
MGHIARQKRAICVEWQKRALTPKIVSVIVGTTHTKVRAHFFQKLVCELPNKRVAVVRVAVDQIYKSTSMSVCGIKIRQVES